MNTRTWGVGPCNAITALIATAVVAVLAPLPLAAQEPLGDWAVLTQTIDALRSRALAAEKASCTRRDQALRDWARIKQDARAKPDAVERAAAAQREAASACELARQQLARANVLWEDLQRSVGQSCNAANKGSCPQAELAARVFGMPASETVIPPAAAAPTPPAQRLAGPATATTPAPAPAPALVAAVEGKPGESPASSPAPSPAAEKPPSEEEFQALMKTAAGAQAVVNKLKTQRQPAFDRGDQAAQRGLEAAVTAELNLGGNRETRLRALDKVEQGQNSRDAAFVGNGATAEAQSCANRLVRHALDLAICRLDGQCKLPQAQSYKFAKEAAAQLETLVKEAEGRFTTVKNEYWKQDLVGLSDKDRATKLAYLQLLDTNPDAKALVGGNAALIEANSGDTEGTIRLSLKRTGIAELRRFSLSFSAPLNDDREATIAQRRADKLSARPSVGVAWSGVSIPEGWGLLASYGLTARIGRSSQRYINDAVPSFAELSTKPREIGLGLTVIMTERSTHSLKVTRQRTWEAGKNSVICPAPAASAPSVSCLQGNLGLPTQQEATVSTYDYRRRTSLLGESIGLGVSAVYNGQSREMDVSIPIYFIPKAESTSDEINAGIRINLVNKKNPEAGRAASVGFFVSTPFSLGGN